MIATGKQYSVREFIKGGAELGIEMRIRPGNGETPTVARGRGHGPGRDPGEVIMRIDPRYFRPAEVETLLGDPTKAREQLWEPADHRPQMCAEMVAEDLRPRGATRF